MELVDTHCHLDAEAFLAEGPEPVLARAVAAGVTRVVTIGTDLASSRRAVALANRHPEVWASVGVDPHWAGAYSATDKTALRDLADNPRVAAIGEIGLDYYWDRAPRPVQRAAFVDQLALASDLGQPVVIHNRDADADTEAVLLDWAAGTANPSPRPLGVLHCFSGRVEMALTLVEAGFLVSFAGNVTYKSATGLQVVARELPESALVLETDSPYLTPVPHRGSRNEPARVSDVAAFVAQLRGVTLEALARITTANAARLFGWAGT